MGKTGNGTVTRSEESITLIASYRLPHYGSRSFTFVQDDVLPSVITQNGGQKKNLHSILLRRSTKPVSSVRLRRPPPYKQGGLPNPYSSRQNPFPQHCSKSFVGALNDALPYLVILNGVRMLYENEEKSQHDTERRIYYTDDALPSYTRIMESAVRRSCWRT